MHIAFGGFFFVFILFDVFLSFPHLNKVKNPKDGGAFVITINFLL